jgi:outer membrane protein TolC
MSRTHFIRVLRIAGLAVLCTAIQVTAGEVKRLTLSEAVHLAIEQNRALRIARFKVRENQAKKAEARSAYFPQLTNQSNALHITELQNIVIPGGALGTAGGTPIPAQNIRIGQGQTTLFSSGNMLAQPLTQLLRILQANRIAAAEVASSEDDLKKAENTIAVQVHTLYYEILVTGLERKAAEQQTSFAAENLRENEEGVRNGSALQVAAIGSRADLLESQQTVLTLNLQLADLKTELDDLLGLPLDTQLELDPNVPTNFETMAKAEYVKLAWRENPEIRAAEEMVRKAQAGVAAEKTKYIPDITGFARHSYQDGVPFLVRNFGTFGVHLEYDIFDFGKRRASVHEREAQLAQAKENLERLRDEVAVAIERSYNKVERTKNMVNVASQVANLRQESERLATSRTAQGELLPAALRQATAANFKAQADLLQASLAYLLAQAELERTVGRTPGL